jgi:uncharacterized membrane protein YjfL (UPF0719 family)
MKKIFLILLLMNVVFAVGFVFADEPPPPPPPPPPLPFPVHTLPPTIHCGTDFFDCLNLFFNIIFRLILLLAVALSTIFIVWAGILYITKGGGKEEDIKKIHQRLVWAAVGLVVALLAYAFVKALEYWVINPVQLPPPPGVPLFNFAFADITEPNIPENLECGGVSLPSVFQESSPTQDIWETCFFYYTERVLSFLYVLALSLGIIFLAWAGILYIIRPEKSKDIHSKLIYGIFGIVLAILSFIIVEIIDLFFFNTLPH